MDLKTKYKQGHILYVRAIKVYSDSIGYSDPEKKKFETEELLNKTHFK